MAFRPTTKPPQFADLKGILAQTKDVDGALYQVIELIIDRLTQLKLVTPEEIQAAVEKNKPRDKPLEKHAPTHMPGGNDILPVSNPSKLLGRGSVSPGPVEEINLGTGLAMSGSTLNASGGVTPGPHGSTHASAGTDVIPVSAASRLLGRGSGSAGPMQELLIGAGLAASGTGLTVSAIPESAINNDALLARVADNEVISGQWTFTGPSVTLQNVNPQLFFTDTDGPVNEKIWRFIANGSSFFLQAFNDAISTAYTVLEIIRNANVPNIINFYTNNTKRTTIDASGFFTHFGGLIFNNIQTPSIPGATSTFDTSGSFMIAVYIASSLNIHGILPRASGTICVILNRHDSAGNLGLIHMEPTAPAANKIACPNNVSFNLPPGGAATLFWDGIFQQWKVIGTNI